MSGSDNSFASGRDDELGGLLREALAAGPDDAFVARVRAAVRATPREVAPLDVLAGWTRPWLAAAAVLLALGLWAARDWFGTGPEVAVRTGSAVQLLTADAAPGSEYVLAGITEGR